MWRRLNNSGENHCYLRSWQLPSASDDSQENNEEPKPHRLERKKPLSVINGGDVTRLLVAIESFVILGYLQQEQQAEK